MSAVNPRQGAATDSSTTAKASDRSGRRPRTSLTRLALIAGLLTLAFPPLTGAPALAQNQKKRQRVIRLDAITVEGRIQKPQAIYILQRSILNFAELERTESFLPKIVQSVEKDCF